VIEGAEMSACFSSSVNWAQMRRDLGLE